MVFEQVITTNLPGSSQFLSPHPHLNNVQQWLPVPRTARASLWRRIIDHLAAFRASDEANQKRRGD